MSPGVTFFPPLRQKATKLMGLIITYHLPILFALDINKTKRKSLIRPDSVEAARVREDERERSYRAKDVL